MQLERKETLNLTFIKFANLIAKNSNTEVVIVNNEKNLSKYLKKFN